MAVPQTLQLLGRASIEGPEGPITGRAAQRHRLALLALLAATPRGMTRDKVVALLWPEREPSRARHALSDSIYRINKALEAEVVVAAGDRDLRLDAEALPSDLSRFRRALETGDWEAAVEVYGGPFLEGFHLAGSVEFEHWLDGERRRLEREYAEALESRAEEQAERGDPAGAVAAWQRRAALDPYDSRVAVRLMEALEAGGNRAAALRHARVHAHLMEQEFGTGPDPDVTAVAERMRSGESAVRGAAAGSTADPEGEEAPSAHPPDGARPDTSSPPPRTPVRSGGPRGAPGADRARDGPWGRPWKRIGIGAGGALAVIGAATLIPDVVPPISGPSTSEDAGASNGAIAARTAAESDVPTMAVLLFEDLSPEGDQEWFAYGMSDAVARALDDVGLRVIGPASSFQFRDTSVDVRRIADSLGVDLVVDGNLRPEGDSVWISSELIDGTDGFLRWSDTYGTSRASEGLRSVQRRIAREIATALSQTVALEPASPNEVIDDRAYDLYLEGRAVLRRFQTGATTDAAEVLASVDYFREVVDLEPRWADGWAGLGEAHHWAAYDVGFERERHWDEAKRTLERALLLDPNHPQANASLGFVLHRLDRDFGAAERYLQRALALDSEQYWHCGYSFYLLWVGRYEEAVQATRRAVAYNPMSWARKALRLSAERCAGRFEEAIGAAERVLSERPDAGGPRRDLALALQRTGRVDEALESLEEGDGPRAYLDLVRVLVLARSARIDEAKPLLDRVDLDAAVEWAEKKHAMSEVTVAPLHAAALVALDRPEEAIEVLEEAMDREPDTLIYDRCYPELRSLERDPRYQELLRRTGVPGW